MSDAELKALVKSIQELRESQRETDQVVSKLAGAFSSQWGALVEALVEPGLVQQFQDRGIPINQTAQRLEGIDEKGKQIEIDVLMVNGDTVVGIEVKSKCKTEDVEDHEDRMSRFKEAFPQYADKGVLGGIAALTFDSDCHRYAFKRGLFVLKPMKGVAQILNDEGFRPKEF